MSTVVRLTREPSPVELAADAVAWWWLTVENDPVGTPSRELYEHFERFCREHPALRMKPHEVPTETAWGRALTEIYLCSAIRTASGRRRPLRIKRVTV